MSVIVLLIVAGGVVAGGFLAAFVWAVSAGQYDDTHTPAIRVLLEDMSADNFQLPTPNSQKDDRGQLGFGGWELTPFLEEDMSADSRDRLGIGSWRLGVDGVSRREGSA